MNNFSVLLKYSLKPKIASKKALLGLGGLFAIVVAIVVGIGMLITSSIDEENPMASFIEDTVYVYPDNDISQYILKSIPGAQLTDSDQITDDMTAEDEYVTIINTDSNIVTSTHQLDTVAETTLSMIVSNARNIQAMQAIPAEYQQPLLDSQIPPTFTQTTEEMENSGFLYGIGFVSTLIIYFAIVFGIQLLGSEIFEEKNSRAMEIIITNVKPNVHMLVKILSTFIFLLTIGLTLILGVVAGLGVVVGIIIMKSTYPDITGLINDGLSTILSTFDIAASSEFFIFLGLNLICGLLAILLFQILAAVTAAMSTSYEDYQKANGPVIIFLLIPYFISIFGVEMFSKVLVYVPFFTPFFAPKLYLANELTLTGFSIAVAIQFITVILMFKLTAPIYREGLLNYSTSSLKSIVKRAFQK